MRENSPHLVRELLDALGLVFDVARDGLHERHRVVLAALLQCFRELAQVLLELFGLNVASDNRKKHTHI
jgi:hypothetical protein